MVESFKRGDRSLAKTLAMAIMQSQFIQGDDQGGF
jgi:hypothetical protein